MGGCLSVCCWAQECETIDIWVMKEYKVQSSWTKFILKSSKINYIMRKNSALTYINMYYTLTLFKIPLSLDYIKELNSSFYFF